MTEPGGTRVAVLDENGGGVDESEIRIIFFGILKARLGLLVKKRKILKDKPPTIDEFVSLAESVFNETIKNAKSRAVVRTKRVRS